MAIRNRSHNEWFQPLSKKVCACGASKHKLRTQPAKAETFQVVAWGEYHVGKFRTVDHICTECVRTRMIPRLVGHLDTCGCAFAFQARSGYTLPMWLKVIEQELSTCKKS